MALILSNLISELNAISNQSVDASQSIGVPITNFTNTLLPIVVPNFKIQADIVLLQSMKSITPNNKLQVALPPILSVYAATLALGMQPVFTATPPPTQIILTDVFSVPQPVSVFSVNFSTRLYLWFLSGIAVNNQSGVTIPWS